MVFQSQLAVLWWNTGTVDDDPEVDMQNASPPVGWALTQDKPPGHRLQDGSLLGRVQPTNSIPNLVWGATWGEAIAIGSAVAGAAIAMHSLQVRQYIGAAGGLGLVATGVCFASQSVRILLRIRRLLHERTG